MADHKNLRLLDGGRKRWVAEGRPLSRKSPDASPVAYTPGTADFTSRVGRDDLRAKLGNRGGNCWMCARRRNTGASESARLRVISGLISITVLNGPDEYPELRTPTFG